jgi:hypothetical protein
LNSAERCGATASATASPTINRFAGTSFELQMPYPGSVV